MKRTRHQLAPAIPVQEIRRHSLTFYYWISRGVDERPVRADRIRKSVGAENTFITDLFALGEARDALQPIIEKFWHHCEATGTWARTVTLKVKYADFHQITRSLISRQWRLMQRSNRSATRCSSLSFRFNKELDCLA